VGEHSALANEPARSSRRARLGRQSQAREIRKDRPLGNKGGLFLELPGIAGDRTLALAMPVKAPSTACGERVGGVSEGPTREIRSAEQSEGRTLDALATVEGIPVCGMALTFAGQRRNVDLGSVRHRERVSSPLGDAPATTDVQRAPRKGTTSACTLRSACTGREKHGNVPLTLGR
jgi:hypothetical protein